jgi:integrase-like protein
MVVFAAATGLRPSELFGLEQRDVDREAGVVYVRRAFANGRLKQTKTRLSNRAVPLQAKALEALEQLPAAENEILFANTLGGRIDFRSFGRRHWKPAPTSSRHRSAARPLRPAPHLRDFRPARGSPGVCRLPVHGFEHRDDRLPLRPSRPRQPRARGVTPRRARARTRCGRWVDAAREADKPCLRQSFRASSKAVAAQRGRSVDVNPPTRRLGGERKELISRELSKPSDGLEPSTPSLPFLRQPVATHGNAFRLFGPFSRPLHLPPVATGCDRSALSEEGRLVKFG